MARKLLVSGMLAFFGFFAVFSSVFAEEGYYGEVPFYIESGSVLVMDADTGRVLFELGGYAQRYPASITKVMTALLVAENVHDLNEVVVFSNSAVNLPFYAATFHMQPGERLTVLGALYGLMLVSGNDLARGLAEHVSGSVDAFVGLMNTRARELGAMSTQFVNACGLPGAGQSISALDIALIMREAIRHPVLLEIMSSPYMEFHPTNFFPQGRTIRNTHRMIRVEEPEYDSRVVGGKTGFTNAARHTLVSYAEYDGFRLIVSVLYSPNRTTFIETSHLLDIGFAILHEERLAAELRELERQEAIRREIERLEQERLAAIERALIGEPLEIINSDVLPFDKYKSRAIIYISDIEAAVVASSSLAVALVSLGFIKFIYGRKKRHIKEEFQ